MDLRSSVRDAIASARSVVVLTGAGVSAESGISTFRAAGGHWAKHRPEELASPGGFRADPRRVWEWYELRRSAVLECRPNRRHVAIAEFLRTGRDVTLVTQNVDGLHQRAFAELEPKTNDRSRDRPDSTVELHGNLLRTRCSSCETPVAGTVRADSTSIASLPRCRSCRALLRPDVVWFGEMLAGGTIDRAFRAARAAEICLVVGTSAVVQPAASLPAATVEAGGTVIEVNPKTTPVSTMAQWVLRGTSADVLPDILDVGV